MDIYPQAVEVAQLSLYLKLLEDETTASARDYQLELRDALLPSLNKNIICGNSLIGLDILDGQLFEMDEETKLRPMNFEDALPQVMKAGGFDAVVETLRTLERRGWIRSNLTILGGHTRPGGSIDLYLLFIEKALRLMKEPAYFGYITPKFLLFNLDAEPARKRMLGTRIIRIADAGQVFKGVNTECAVTVLQNSPSERSTTSVEIIDTNGRLTWTNEIRQESFNTLPNKIFNIYLTDRDLLVVNKVLAQPHRLGELVSIKRGMELGKKLVRDSVGDVRTLLGEDVSRYSIRFGGTYVSSDQDEVKRLSSHSEVRRSY